VYFTSKDNALKELSSSIEAGNEKQFLEPFIRRESNGLEELDVRGLEKVINQKLSEKDIPRKFKRLLRDCLTSDFTTEGSNYTTIDALTELERLSKRKTWKQR